MSIRIGGIDAAGTGQFLDAMSTPFGFDIPDGERPEQVEQFQVLFEAERARCAFDGDQMVGTLGAFSLQMVVPGGRLPVAGTTMVTVLPTHRRRGALRGMMEAHFEEVRGRGEALAALWASDSAIYHRFGFGMATVLQRVRVNREHARFHRLAPETIPVRMIGVDAICDIAPSVYEQVLGTRPGMYARHAGWWERRFRDRKEERGGATAFRYAVAERNGVAEGYTQYRINVGPWTEHHGDAEIKVTEVMSTTPQAAASLWSFLLGHDLTAVITANNLAEDDPLLSFLDGWRRTSPTVGDQMWVRILDLPAALQGRRYGCDGVLILSVHDPMTSALTTHRLEVSDGEASVRPAVGDADMQLDIADLGAAYLGRARFRPLARAGRLTGSDEALALADAMFSWDPAPWCQEVF